MKFILKRINGNLPNLTIGPKGRELNCFVPNELTWEQINYGQGEGQILIDGCEWGFYYTDDDAISVVLHEGNISQNEALEFIDKIKEKVFCSIDFSDVKIEVIR